MTQEEARKLLTRLDPFITLDNGPRVVDIYDGTGTFREHAPRYNTDPYGLLFRTDVRLSDIVELTGWDIAVQIPEVERLLTQLTA